MQINIIIRYIFTFYYHLKCEAQKRIVTTINKDSNLLLYMLLVIIYKMYKTLTLCIS